MENPASITPFCLTKSDLEAYLSALGLPFQTQTHEAVFTVEALLKHADSMPGHHHKHMFLKDKKTGELVLVVARHDRTIDLNNLGKALGNGSGRLRFAAEETLYEKLGVKKGAVTVFALINDKPRDVKVVLDVEILQTKPDQLLWFHPMENTATTGITSNALKVFLAKCGHTIVQIRFGPDKNVEVLK